VERDGARVKRIKCKNRGGKTAGKKGFSQAGGGTIKKKKDHHKIRGET